VAVDVDGDPRGASELRQPLPLLAPVHGIGDDDVVEAVGREHLRLCNLRHRDAVAPARACSAAISGDLCVLMCGGSASLLLDGVLPSVDVGLERGKVDDEARRRQRLDTLPDGARAGTLALSLMTAPGSSPAAVATRCSSAMRSTLLAQNPNCQQFA